LSQIVSEFIFVGVRKGKGYIEEHQVLQALT